MKRFMNKKVAAIGLAAGLALGARRCRLAYWTSTGSGSGQAATGTASSDLAFSDTLGSLNALAPGTGAQDFTTTVTNNSTTQNAYVAGVTAYVTVAEGLPGSGVTGYTCSSADYKLDGVAGTSPTNQVTLAWTATDLAASGGNASTAGTDTIQFNDLTTTDQDACQGATVTVHYTSS